MNERIPPGLAVSHQNKALGAVGVVFSRVGEFLPEDQNAVGIGNPGAGNRKIRHGGWRWRNAATLLIAEA